MANITVSTSLSNVAVNTTSNVVTVTSTPSNVTVTSLTTANIAAVRNSLSATNVSGYGNLTYSNITGVFSYVGVSNSDIRGTISNTSPILYNSTTGVIDIDSNAIFSGKTTDDLAEGNTNLYFTTDRSNTAVENYISGSGNINFANGVISESLTTTDITEGDNLYYTTARANSAIGAYTGSLENLTGNITTTANIQGSTLKSTGTLGLVVTGNATIGGNLDVTGNINSETVVDLLVEDRNITLQYGLVGTPTNNAHIFIDRGSSANVAIFWDETNDTWAYNSSNVLDTTADKNFVPYYNANSNVDYAGNIRLSNTSIANSVTVSNVYSNPSFETAILGGNIETAGRKLRFHNDISVGGGNKFYGNAEVSSLYGAVTFTRPEGSQPLNPSGSTNFGNL